METIVAPATPAGIGAIGVIRLSGQEAITIAQSVFSKTIIDKPTHTLHFGKIQNNAGPEQVEVIDEVVLSLFHGPHSYTGENVIEISCHGSPFIMQRILELLVKKGARMAKAGEFTLRAFLNGKLDLTQAEAVGDLIASENETARKMAIHQMRGGFSAKIKALRTQLIDFASLVELELDFGEEDVEFADRGHLHKLVVEILDYVNRLKSGFALGNVLKNGISTVIAGKPNAGKSTVLNALLNEERAIVSSIAGTTRDTIEEAVSIEGVKFRFIDTAGIRQSSDEIEGLGIERTFEKLGEADLIIYVFDVASTTKEALQKELEQLQITHQDLIIVANKTDLTDVNAIKTQFSDLNQLVFISGKNGDLAALHNILHEKASTLNQGATTLVNNSRHYEALHQSSVALEDVLNGLNSHTSSDFIALDIRKALFHLGEITGDISNDDLLKNIFSKFCIGK